MSPFVQLNHPYTNGKWNLHQIQAVLQSAPAPIVHTDAFVQNAETLWASARAHHKNLRIATKSLRIPDLIELAASIGGQEPMLMCYSVSEAAFLVEWSTSKHGNNRFQDVLIAYPTVDKDDILLAYDLNLKGAKVVLMIDSEEHIRLIERIVVEHRPQSANKPVLPVCVDVDCSLRFFGGAVHLGAHRSPCHSVDEFAQILSYLQHEQSVLRFCGVMTYEAQVAGVGDSSFHNSRLYNLALRGMKYLSMRHVKLLRKQIASVVDARGLKMEIFNGGGTGNIDEAASDPYLTEVTAGSGFLQPELFDYYTDNMCSPALAIALQVTRIQSTKKKPNSSPQSAKSDALVSEVVCCQSGGFIASGSVASDKAPSVFLPRGLSPFNDEGFGEVQTPLQVGAQLQESGLDPKLGSFVLIRPAKSGEVTERFNKVFLLNEHTSPTSPPTTAFTYRGYGKAFF